MSRKTTPTTSTTSTPVPSPSGGQRSIQTMLQQEKESGKTIEVQMITQMFQNIQGSIQSIQAKTDKIENMEKNIEHIGKNTEETGKRVENMEKKMENMEKKMENMDKKIEATDGKVENLQQMLQQYDTRIKKIEEEDLQRDKKMDEMDTRLIEVERDKSGLGWEMDRSEFYLRFQNVQEEKGEDLTELMADILAEALEITIDKMKDEMDEIFRVYTRYAMRNKLPREVHIRFTKKTIKTQILQVTRDKTLKYKEKEITVLKQVPRRIRDIRREYSFLTKELIKRGINYRWLVPEGLLFTWQEQRHRIDSIDKAEAFVMEYFRGREAEKRSEDVQTIDVREKELVQILDKELGAAGGVPREQREVRATRAINPIYKT